MTVDRERLRSFGILMLLFVCMAALLGRLCYLMLADSTHFPINVVKISASYQHITRQQLESVLSVHLRDGFFGLSTAALQHDLLELSWIQTVTVKRVWPDSVTITLTEKKPIAVCNGMLMTETGTLFHADQGDDLPASLPKLMGPVSQQKDVLQIYEKLSKLLEMYGLSAESLQLRENQAWELVLTNGMVLRLGKRDLALRLRRFCRAYPAVFATKSEQLSSVDLRYARGMA